MRKQSAKKRQVRMLLGLLWVAIIVVAIWLWRQPAEDKTSTVVPGAITSDQLLNDVGSGQALQGSPLPLGVSSPQQTAKPN